jgi:hypothetical protein
MIPSPVNSPTVLSDHGAHHRRAVDQRCHDLAQLLRTTTEAMSIEWTTSANRTVTCLYSAWTSLSSTGERSCGKPGVLRGLGATRLTRTKDFESPRPAARDCEHSASNARS